MCCYDHHSAYLAQSQKKWCKFGVGDKNQQALLGITGQIKASAIWTLDINALANHHFGGYLNTVLLVVGRVARLGDGKNRAPFLIVALCLSLLSFCLLRGIFCGLSDTWDNRGLNEWLS